MRFCHQLPLALALVLGSTTLPAMSQPSGTVTPHTGFVNTLMPEPAQLVSRPGQLAVGSNWSVATGTFHDLRLDAAVQRTVAALRMRTGIELTDAVAHTGTDATLIIEVDGPGQAIQSIDENETYTLAVTPAGIHLHATTDVGAMRGLTTLVQLVQADASGYFLPAISIDDSPRFRWRGLMIDCGRHFEPVELIKRTLDGMAAVKLNVFHWHLSEDQGFRMESKLFPKLTGLGSDGLYYTQEQAREIVAYARDRGIRVVPEFDMPGHASAWFVGYPELASGPGPFHIERRFGIFDPVMDPTRESTYAFLDKFIGEMAALFPDAYMHIGGDENNGNAWKNSPRIQEFMRQHGLKDTAALQAYFNQRLLPILQKHGKRMIGWDEVLTPGLPKDVVVQSWRGFDSLAAGARQGYEGILSAGYYLDHMDSAAEHYRVDPLPANNGLTPEQQARILGGEACMWSESVDQRTIDSRIWPRTAAIAERLWSPQRVNNVDDMYRRLAVMSLRLEAVGLTQLSQEDVSLRQIANSTHIEELRVLASVLEPVVFDERDQYTQEHNVTQWTPLDHLVDALPPDPPSRYHFAQLVSSVLRSSQPHTQEAEELRATFASWENAEQPVLAVMSGAPLLTEATPRARELAQLGALGREALAYLSSGESAPAGWKSSQLAVLDASAKSVALTRFTVIQPLRTLVAAVPEK